MDWKPSASIETLRKRAAFLHEVREFFRARDVLEVDTPCLSVSTVTDTHLDPLSTIHQPPDSPEQYRLFLQTSPEYYMKRMLAAGVGDCFYLGKCFRDDELGKLHCPEFTMLEWYRVGFSMQQLVDEVSSLLESMLDLPIEQITYQAAFESTLGFNPHAIDVTRLKEIASQHGLADYANQVENSIVQSEEKLDGKGLQTALKDTLLQVLFSQCIEGVISRDKAVIVTHFPSSQASLAVIDDSGDKALRFEVYANGVELANGFEELTDPKEQMVRFEKDNELRQCLGKPTRKIDKAFIAALESGLPKCAGVAIGFDRLLMCSLRTSSISEVMSFDIYANRHSDVL